MKKYYIVWNAAKTEGYVTDAKMDALYVSTGDTEYLEHSFITPTAGDAFRECYDDEDLSMEAVELY